MQQFTDFVAADHLSAESDPAARQQPARRRAEPGAGATSAPCTDGGVNCNGCHTLDPANGFFGGNGNSSVEGETQEFKIPHLRNVYQKVGMFGLASTPGLDGSFANLGDQVRGFGVLHDGAIDTVRRFLNPTTFSLTAADRVNLRGVHHGLRHRPPADGRPADHPHEHQRRRRRPAHHAMLTRGVRRLFVEAARPRRAPVRRDRQGPRRRPGARLPARHRRGAVPQRPRRGSAARRRRVARAQPTSPARS